MNAIEKEYIDIRNVTFNDVFCVPHLSDYFISIYQITHGGASKTMKFTLDSVLIRDFENRYIITIGVVDHASQVYTFPDFVF